MARLTNSQKRWLKRGSDPRKVARLQRKTRIVKAALWLFALLVSVGMVAALIGGFWMAVAAGSRGCVLCILFLAFCSVPTFDRMTKYLQK